MKVLYDHQIFCLQKTGGISRYFVELIKNLDHQKDCTCQLPSFLSINDHIKDLIPGRRSVWSQSITNRLIYGYGTMAAEYSLLKNKFDVFHPTFYSFYFKKTLRNKPYVVTVHDLIDEKYNGLDSPKKNILESASAIISISENTKNDLIDYYRIPEEKIYTVHHGVSDIFLNINRTNSSKDERHEYLLYVGRREGYKNFDFTLKAISKLLKRNEIKLICIGGGSFTTKELALMDYLQIPRLVEHFYADDNRLVELYSRATAFIFPSVYEGFGIPLLEAFAAGCPVICSNTSSFPEVAGDAALFFDPESETSIINAVQKVLNDKGLQQKMTQLGYERVEKFSWKCAAEKTLKVYKSVV